MRVEAAIVSMSWIPSESLRGAMKRGMDLRLSHWDQPPPDHVDVGRDVHAMCADDRFRFANLLAASVEIENDRVVAARHAAHSGLVIGSTNVSIGGIGARFRAAALPTIQREPEFGADGSVRLVQTAGGRTGVPLPRPVPHAPFVRWQAPLVWTTLALTIRPDGSCDVELAGASAFPRHWVYDTDGHVALKSGLTDQAGWMNHSFGPRTPWGDQDTEAVVTAAESDLERTLSTQIMHGGRRPQVRRYAAGETLMRQGAQGNELMLLLDGIVTVAVDNEVLAELGPGAVLGERAVLEGGVRTSTITSTTPVRVAVAPADQIDLDRLRTLAASHRREAQVISEDNG